MPGPDGDGDLRPTSVRVGVRFDLDANGTREHTSPGQSSAWESAWTRAQGPRTAAFLTPDLNGKRLCGQRVGVLLATSTAQPMDLTSWPDMTPTGMAVL